VEQRKIRHAAAVLTLVAAKFREYQEYHTAKGTPESLAKAETNCFFAGMCESSVRYLQEGTPALQLIAEDKLSIAPMKKP